MRPVFLLVFFVREFFFQCAIVLLVFVQYRQNSTQNSPVNRLRDNFMIALDRWAGIEHS